MVFKWPFSLKTKQSSARKEIKFDEPELEKKYQDVFELAEKLAKESKLKLS